MDLGLRGKTALVTGSSKGIGKACATAFTAEGTRVSLCARSLPELDQTAAELRASGAEVLATTANVTVASDVQRLIDRTLDRFGSIDILVANAGGPPFGNFDELTDDQWRAATELSMKATLRLVRAVVPHMRARRWGRIVSIQSTSVLVPIEGLALSNTIRPVVAQVLTELSAELAADGILINVVCPGRTLTERFMAGHKRAGLSPEEYLRAQAAQIPLSRIADPAEIANVVVFLASQAASGITGQLVPVDGGIVAAQ
jgi:3-oxoacyl-[acyl-carrier protein] reductase